jgi:hypothetical protein
VILEFEYTIHHYAVRMEHIQPTAVTTPLAHFIVVRPNQSTCAERLEHRDQHQRARRLREKH